MVVFAAATPVRHWQGLFSHSLSYLFPFPLVKLVWWEKEIESSDLANMWCVINATQTQVIEKAKVPSEYSRELGKHNNV